MLNIKIIILLLVYTVQKCTNSREVLKPNYVFSKMSSGEKK